MCCQLDLWTVMDLQCSVELYFFLFWGVFFVGGLLVVLPHPCHSSILVTFNSGMATALSFFFLSFILLFFVNSFDRHLLFLLFIFVQSLPLPPLCSSPLSLCAPCPLPPPLSVY